MKFFIRKTEGLPRAAQKSLAPRKEFIEKGREQFLAAFDASALATERMERTAGMAMFFKIGVVAMAVVCVAAGMSVYADTANVSATNPLYPLKRLSENIQLTFTPASQKPRLEATFAVRRVKEIDALRASHPTSTLIPALTDDLDSEISSSLAAITGASAGNPADTSTAVGITTHGSAGVFSHGNRGHGQGSPSLSVTTPPPAERGSNPLNVYCAAFDSSTSSVLFGHLDGELVAHPDALRQFNLQCGSGSRGDGGGGTTSTRDGTGSDGPSSADGAVLGASISATTTTPFVVVPQAGRSDEHMGDN